MATRQTSSRSLTKIAGAILLALGLLLLFANFDGMVAPISSSFSPPADSLGTAFQLGLAGMCAVQAYFFDHPSFLSGVERFLISFWPLLLMIAGGVLLRHTVSERFASVLARGNASSRGDRS